MKTAVSLLLSRSMQAQLPSPAAQCEDQWCKCAGADAWNQLEIARLCIPDCWIGNGGVILRLHEATNLWRAGEKREIWSLGRITSWNDMCPKKTFGHRKRCMILHCPKACTHIGDSGRTGHLLQTCRPSASVPISHSFANMQNIIVPLPNTRSILGQHQNRKDPWTTSFTVSSLHTLQLQVVQPDWAQSHRSWKCGIELLLNFLVSPSGPAHFKKTQMNTLRRHGATQCLALYKAIFSHWVAMHAFVAFFCAHNKQKAPVLPHLVLDSILT